MQSDDGYKFNRGKLLNVGFRQAQTHVPLESSDPPFTAFCFHDVDLIPGPRLAQWYVVSLQCKCES